MKRLKQQAWLHQKQFSLGRLYKLHVQGPLLLVRFCGTQSIHLSPNAGFNYICYIFVVVSNGRKQTDRKGICVPSPDLLLARHGM